MTRKPFATATAVRSAVACLCFVVASSAFGQVASPPAPKHHAAVQQAPGEGDPGESAEIDEATDAKPHDGPYRSPYKLAFKAPLHDLLFDAGQPRGSK
ncbi:MAG: hypothetical protein ACKOK8_06925, partial [Planctomycetia bacterium]